MKKMKINLKRYIRTLVYATALIITAVGCELQELDINTDPNTASEVSLDLLLTSAEWNGINTFADRLNNAQMGFLAINTTDDDFNFTNTTFSTYTIFTWYHNTNHISFHSTVDCLTRYSSIIISII